jgi:hypothetical protein
MTIGSIFRPILELCRETHTDVSAILREEGLTAEQLVDPETRLPTERSRALGKRIFAALKDPEAGLKVAERFRPEDADLIFYLARNSPSALEALRALAEYARLIGDSAVCSLTVSTNTVELAFGLTGGRTPLPEAVDYTVAVFARGAVAATLGRARLLKARLARPRPRHIEAYRRAIYDLPGVALANGAAADDKGRLYVADSTHGTIWRLSVDTANPLTITMREPFSTGNLFPNGLKVFGGAVYYTDFVAVKRIPLLADGSAGALATLAAQLTFFDDLYVDDRGIFIANYLFGSVEALTSAGVDVLDTAAFTFSGPSSVLPAKGRLGLGQSDYLVTEKTANRLCVFHAH